MCQNDIYHIVAYQYYIFLTYITFSFRCSDMHIVKAVIISQKNGKEIYRPCAGNEVDGYEHGCVAKKRASGGATGSIMYGSYVFNQVRTSHQS